MNEEQKLAEFARVVLATMQADTEWSSDTLEAIANVAASMGLARGVDGSFRAMVEV